MTGAELAITEPELLERLAMGDEEFREYATALVSALPARACDEAAIERAFGYPWERPEGSFLLDPGGTRPLTEMSAAERRATIDAYGSDTAARMPLLAIGSNGSPATLERKFAHFEREEDRSLLALAGALHDFDVGFSAQPTLYGSMPATVFPSPGTAAAAALLWVTPAQFTQLAWSELSYRLGGLRTRFEVAEGGATFEEVVVFVSRFGAFRVDGEPVALAAVPARERHAPELSQEQALAAAAELAIGGGAGAEDLVRAIHEDFAGLLPAIAETVNREAEPFESDRWTPLVPEA